MTITVDVPIAVKNPLNTREHWRTKAKRVKKQRAGVGMLLRMSQDTSGFAMLGMFRRDAAPWVRVTLTRFYANAGHEMDDDGCMAALKHVRDEVAAYFGVDDADPRIEWRYAQAKGKAAVRISFEVTT